jgi:hypothetical protein
MKIEKFTTDWLTLIVGVSFLLSIYCLFLPDTFSNKSLIAGIFIGIFGSGLISLLTSLISFYIKFGQNMNHFLFCSKRIIGTYKNVTQPTLENITIVSERINLLYEDFYSVFSDIEFNLFTIKYKKEVDTLFEKSLEFIRPFFQVNDILEIDEDAKKSLNLLVIEIGAISKIELGKFESAYKNLYSTYNPGMFNYLKDMNIL